MSTQYQWEEPQPETRRHHKRRRQANAAPADRFDEDNQEGENDDTTLPNTYQSIHGDCTDSEALSVTRKARRLGYHHSSDSDSNSSDEDEGDTLQASNASSQHKDANGQFSMQELLSGKFDEAVRKIGRDQERRTSNVSRCWGCRHGISGGSNIADETLSKFNEWIRKHFGTMDEQEFAIQCARYHTLKVRRPQVKAGGHCDKWRADSILKHFRHHTCDPAITTVQRLQTLRKMQHELRSRMIRKTLDENGEETQEVNSKAMELYLRILDRECSLQKCRPVVSSSGAKPEGSGK